MAALVSYKEHNSKLAHAAKTEVDVVDRRRRQQMAFMEAEEEMRLAIEHSEAAARQQARMNDQNQLLAAELERRRVLQERKEREIQRICEESEELKELERRLKVAYMNKERAAQHEERQQLERMERELEQAIEDQMEHDRQAMIAAEMDKEKYRKVIGEEQRAVLQIQIEEREELIRQAKLEAEKDKQMVEAIVQKIEAEDRKEIEIRERRKEETRQLIRAYEVQHKQEMAEKKIAEKAAEDEIRRHMEAIAKRSEGVQKAKEEKEAHAAMMFKKIAEEAEQKQREADELQRLRDMLWEEEMEAARKRDTEQRKAKREAMKVEMAMANKHMLEAKAKAEEIDMAAEAKLVNMMMAKFAEDEAKEKQEEADRAAARQKYKLEISAQRLQRSEMYEKEKATELEAIETQKQEEEYRKFVVAEARRRLLEEHAGRLSGFLPKGAIRNQEELKILHENS
uniref:Meiosis-specific nuclear structural protein 1 n=1 Tax=Rhizochromulina marina TaxID=1034831 RepID=A0A7S2SMY8_9STRA